LPRHLRQNWVTDCLGFHTNPGESKEAAGEQHQRVNLKSQTHFPGNFNRDFVAGAAPFCPVHFHARHGAAVPSEALFLEVGLKHEDKGAFRIKKRPAVIYR
jgi:hypothetical protein